MLKVLWLISGHTSRHIIIITQSTPIDLTCSMWQRGITAVKQMTNVTHHLGLAAHLPFFLTYYSILLLSSRVVLLHGAWCVWVSQPERSSIFVHSLDMAAGPAFESTDLSTGAVFRRIRRHWSTALIHCHLASRGSHKKKSFRRHKKSLCVAGPKHHPNRSEIGETFRRVNHQLHSPLR